MKYALSVAFLMLCVASPAHACFACFPSCWPDECANVGYTSAWTSCSICMDQCNPQENCWVSIAQKGPSGNVQISCAAPAAIYPPIRPLAAAELPGTIGVDVRVLSTDDVLIDRVLRGSPAYLAGLRRGDRLNFINEARAASVPYNRIMKMNPGESVRVTVTRRGQALKYDMVAVRLDQLNARTMSADAQRRGGASGGY
jgi:PDZ domain-containing protein